MCTYQDVRYGEDRDGSIFIYDVEKSGVPYVLVDNYELAGERPSFFGVKYSNMEPYHCGGCLGFFTSWPSVEAHLEPDLMD